MTNNNNDNALHIPAQRYFTLYELCEIVQISPKQFAEWQNANGIVIGHGGNRYTRADIVKIRQLKDTFAPFIDSFNNNGLDDKGNPAANAVEVAIGLKKIVNKIENALAKA